VKKQGYKLHLFLSIFAGLVVISLLAGCAGPPAQKIADAQAALEKAKAAGAEIYAGKQYKKAQGLLKDALTYSEKAYYFEAERAAKNAIAAAGAAEKATGKAMKGARKEANFEAAALGSDITTAQGLIANAKKKGATDKDLGEARTLLDRAIELYGQVKSMLKTESYLSAQRMSKRGQKLAGEAGSKAFEVMQKTRGGGNEAAKKAAKKAARARAYAKREANFEVAAAGAAIRTAENMVNKAANTPRADKVELGSARTQLSQAKSVLERAQRALSQENFKGAIQKGTMSRELAENASSSAFKAIAMSKKPTK